MSNKDYYSAILCLGAKQRTTSPLSVAFYDMPGKVWAASIFFVPVRDLSGFSKMGGCSKGRGECVQIKI